MCQLNSFLCILKHPKFDPEIFEYKFEGVKEKFFVHWEDWNTSTRNSPIIVSLQLLGQERSD